MQQIGDWLKNLGMSEYAERFAENRIDLSVLPDLTDQDLEKLGVLLGDRRKMLRAIRELAGAPPVTPHSLAVNEAKSQDAAERRQLTVMFCDLVGSTALSARLDPEDLRAIIVAYQRCCAVLVERNGGFVAKYMGDGVLAYFGYPQAHEDDAERAVRAGLTLVEAVPKLATAAGSSLQVRVGIATGLVVVGDLIGAGAAQEQAVVGETPNLAARLQAQAAPGELVIAEGTRRLIGALFELDDLGPQALKGFAEARRAWRVIAENRALSRYEALRSGATPLVGREEELELLMRRWRHVAGGDGGRVILLSAEPGFGKSRLVMELEECLVSEPHATLRYFSSPNDTDSAFHPVIMQLERAAGLHRHDSPAAKLEKLSTMLQPPPEHKTDIRLLAELMAIPIEGVPPLSIGPERKKRKTLEALLRHLEELSRQRPVLMVYEDVHWLDPSSRELLDMSVERVAKLPVLLVVTFRPVFQPPWVGQAHVTALILNRLASRDSLALSESVAGVRTLPHEIAAEIVERADGIPLFVEELTKAVLEAQIRGPDGRGRPSSGPPPGFAIPSTLHGSLMARLDRLGPGIKEIAQMGAVIGREFAYEILSTVAGRSDGELEAALSALAAAELVYCRGTPPQATFLFKHAMVRDAAYGSLLRRPRQELHRRIGDVLKEALPDTTEGQPELIAHHYTEAGLPDEAIPWWRAAGEKASRRSANAEAVAHWSKALELVGALPQDRKRDQLELSVRIDLGGPLIATKGYNSAELEKNYARAWTLCERLNAVEQAFPVLWGQYLVAGYKAEGGLAVTEEKARRFTELARQQGDTGLQVIGHRMLGVQLVSRCDFTGGRQHLERAIALYDPAKHQPLAFTYGINPRVSARVTLGLTLQYLGYLDQASRAAEEAVEEAKRSDHFNTLGVALHLAGRLRAFRREGTQLRALASELIALSREQGSPGWQLVAEIFLGWQEAKDGALLTGLERVRLAIDALRVRKLNVWLPAYLLLQAELCCEAGRFDESLVLLDEAGELIIAQGHPVCEAEVHRLRACTELARSSAKVVVEACFDRAFDVARRQGARFWELRTAVSRARYWCEQGRRDEAHDLLAPIYGWFSEGIDTPDLKSARALLEALKS
jgi:class 3 adenylate cyclase/tetratricopeptide (TPR) repeat protein